MGTLKSVTEISAAEPSLLEVAPAVSKWIAPQACRRGAKRSLFILSKHDPECVGDAEHKATRR